MRNFWRWLKRLFARRYRVKAEYGLVLEGYRNGSRITVSAYEYEPMKVGKWYRRGDQKLKADGSFLEFIPDDQPWYTIMVRQGPGGVYGMRADEYNDGAQGHERQILEDPVGTYRDRVWPNPHVTARGLKNCTVTIEHTKHAPMEILLVEDSTDCTFIVSGSGNNVRASLGRAAVRDVRGSGNAYKLDVSSRCVAFRVDNSRGMITASGVIRGGSVLGDYGVGYVLGRLDPGLCTFRNLDVHQNWREYPAGTKAGKGIFLDDFASSCILDNVRIYGADIGVYVHGGSWNRMEVQCFGVIKPLVITGALGKHNDGRYPVPPEGNEWKFTTDDGGQILYDNTRIER